MNIEEMQSKWSEIDNRISSLENTLNANQLSAKRTAKDNIAKKYRNLGLFALIACVALSNPLYEIMGLGIALYFVGYLALSSAMDFYLYNQVLSIELSTMSVTEVSEKAQRYRRLHRLFQLILIPPAGVLIALMIVHELNDAHTLLAMAIGCALGLVIGFIIYLSIMRNYQKLI